MLRARFNYSLGHTHKVGPMRLIWLIEKGRGEKRFWMIEAANMDDGETWLMAGYMGCGNWVYLVLMTSKRRPAEYIDENCYEKWLMLMRMLDDGFGCFCGWKGKVERQWWFLVFHDEVTLMIKFTFNNEYLTINIILWKWKFQRFLLFFLSSHSLHFFSPLSFLSFFDFYFYVS